VGESVVAGINSLGRTQGNLGVSPQAGFLFERLRTLRIMPAIRGSRSAMAASPFFAFYGCNVEGSGL
jgi:hypothetical protein